LLHAFLVSEFDASNSLNHPTASRPGKNNPAIDSQLTHTSFSERAFNLLLSIMGKSLPFCYAGVNFL